MHLGFAAGQGHGEAADQPAQILVPEPRRSDDQRRFRGQLPPEAAAALVYRAVGVGLVAGLSRATSPPREMRQHPIGTGPFKFVEFKPNESHQADPQPGLLEAGPALSRRHRVHDHPQRLDLDPGARRPQVRPHRAGLRAGLAVEGDQEPGARHELRDQQLEHQPHRDHQPRRAAVRQSRTAPGDHAGARPQGLYRHHRRGPGRDRRDDAAAAQRRLGHAGGDAAHAARLRPRRREEPGAGAARSCKSSATGRTSGWRSR